MSDQIRIAHISDTHLGYRGLTKTDPETGRNQRTVDVDNAFERTMDDILTQDVDLVIHSGDVFHHTRPTWHSLRHFIRQMRRLEARRIPTIVIAGNHDTPRMRTGGSAYSVLDLALPDIRFVADYTDQIVRETPFAELNLHLHAVPHGALTNPDPVFPNADPTRRSIMICHGMVPGILAPGVHTESGEQELSAALLDISFDYIALGHYHVPMNAAPKAWYAGATERMGFGDWDVTPGYTLVTMGAPGDAVAVEHVEIEARPMRSLKPMYGNGLLARDLADQILGQIAALDEPTAMVRVELREVERAVRREVESIMRREAEEHVWHLTVAQERTSFTADPTSTQPSEIEGVTDLRTLFAQFVSERIGTTYDGDFATAFLERGDRAIAEALQAQETPAPEEAGTA